MGTRSITLVRDSNNDKIIELYRQFDGYPHGMGKDLLDFIQGGKMGNGISSSPKLGEYFKGIGDFTAQLIAHLKNSVDNIYLHAPTPDDTNYSNMYDAEYVYEIDSELNLTCKSYNDDNIIMSYDDNNEFTFMNVN